MPRWLRFTFVVMMFLLLTAIPLARQFDTGSIEGYVTDEQGTVAKASIEAQNVVTGVTFLVVSDETGHYKLENLRPTRYSLWVTARGHDSRWIPQVVVLPGQAIQIDVYLSTSIIPTRWVPGANTNFDRLSARFDRKWGN